MEATAVSRPAQLGLTLRRATDRDADAIADLTNSAYQVEQFFVDGDRTTAAEIRRLQRDGYFLVLDRADGGLAASVYVRSGGGRGYFGLLAVGPTLQGLGLGRRLVAVAEAMCQAEGCTWMDLRVVNLRSELPPWYRSLGYQESGTEPWPDDSSDLKQPAHFIRMSKPLGDG